jgi:hypothetical protein
MAINKRFTDTGKWQDAWFSGLSLELKLLWLFLIDSCDCAGMWEVNHKYAEFVIGAPVNWEKVVEVFNGRVKCTGKYWFIPKFLAFQYPDGITEDSNFTLGVIRRLRQHQLLPTVIKLYGKSFVRVSQELIKTRPTPQDKDKDKGTSKYIDVFTELWVQYPKKLDKTTALKHFTTSVKSDEDVNAIKKALANYLLYVKDEVTEERYIKHAKTWFNNWRDWIDYKPGSAKVVGPKGREL